MTRDGNLGSTNVNLQFLASITRISPLMCCFIETGTHGILIFNCPLSTREASILGAGMERVDPAERFLVDLAQFHSKNTGITCEHEKKGRRKITFKLSAFSSSRTGRM